jgi:hypothetical protein
MTSHPAFSVGGFTSFSCCAESVREPPIPSAGVPVLVGWAAGRRELSVMRGRRLAQCTSSRELSPSPCSFGGTP